jgi:pilus assembly protein CpaB
MMMKKYGTVIALGLAVVFGALAVWLTNQWLTTKTTEEPVVVKETVPMTKIVVAGRDLGIGTPLSADNLILAQWPKANAPKGTFENVKEVEGRVAITRLRAGSPVLAAELAAPGSGAGLVAVIPDGKRAMSIRVDEVIGVSGFILPNTYVDVIAVGNPEQNRPREVKTILKKIQVLAIAQETTTEEGQAKVVRTVTMEVDPAEAEKLALQTHQGSIHLILRNPLEEEKPEPVVKKVARKVVPKIKPRVYTPKPVPYDIEVIRGTNRENVQFKTAESEERL